MSIWFWAKGDLKRQHIDFVPPQSESYLKDEDKAKTKMRAKMDKLERLWLCPKWYRAKGSKIVYYIGTRMPFQTQPMSILTLWSSADYDTQLPWTDMNTEHREGVKGEKRKNIHTININTCQIKMLVSECSILQSVDVIDRPQDTCALSTNQADAMTSHCPDWSSLPRLKSPLSSNMALPLTIPQ